MTNEEKQILLKDLCARLPYGVIVEYGRKHEGKDLGERKSKLTGRMIDSFSGSIPIGMTEVYSLKPYLRPMESMTKEEREIYESLAFVGEAKYVNPTCCSSVIGFLEEKHLDYNHFIEKGLALEAPEGMYNLK